MSATYLTVACKLLVNVHDLNNEGSVGQALDIRQIRMVGEDGKELPDMPAVSGRMMKHWHLAHMQRAELQLGDQGKLCSDCKIMEPQREPASEEAALQGCVICDGHGFLKAEKVKTEEEGKKVIPRRSSCVMFSWLLPVLGTDQTSKQVIHNRVTSPESPKESMMPFHKSYASGTYGFVCSVDLGRIGRRISGNSPLAVPEIKRRQKLAVQALLPICVGAFGASQSHALPHTRCLGLLAGLSTVDKPLPNLVSPIYAKGFEESMRLLGSLGQGTQAFCYAPDGAEWATTGKKHTVQEVFEAVIQEISKP